MHCTALFVYDMMTMTKAATAARTAKMPNVHRSPESM